MKITLIHCYSDHNRGDTGIIYSIYDLIRNIKPEASIVGMSVFSGNDERFLTDHRHTRKVVNKIYPSFFPEPGIWKGVRTASKVKKLAVFLKYAIFNLLIYITKSHKVARFLFSSQEYESFNNFVTSDKVISKGGSFLYSFKGWDGVFFFIRAIYPFYLGKRFGVDSYIYSQSIGPFENRSAKFLFNRIQPYISGIYLRESACEKYLKKITDNIEVISDSAFALKTNEKEKKDSLRKRLAITARPHRFETQLQKDLYIQSLDRLIEEAGRKYNVYLIPQVTGPTAGEDDREMLRVLYENAKNKENLFLPEEDFDPRQLKALYGQMDYVVGTRLHSVIFALGMGVPCICISYHGTKAEGIMSRLGLSEFILSIDSIKPSLLLKKFTDLEEATGRIKSHMDGDINNICVELYLAMDDILRESE